MCKYGIAVLKCTPECTLGNNRKNGYYRTKVWSICKKMVESVRRAGFQSPSDNYEHLYAGRTCPFDCRYTFARDMCYQVVLPCPGCIGPDSELETDAGRESGLEEEDEYGLESGAIDESRYGVTQDKHQVIVDSTHCWKKANREVEHQLEALKLVRRAEILESKWKSFGRNVADEVTRKYCEERASEFEEVRRVFEKEAKDHKQKEDEYRKQAMARRRQSKGVFA